MIRTPLLLALEVVGIAVVTAAILWFLMRRGQLQTQEILKQAERDIALAKSQLELEYRDKIEDIKAQLKEDLEAEQKRVQELESALMEREVELKSRLDHLDGRSKDLADREARSEALLMDRQRELQRIAALSHEEARAIFLEESSEQYRKLAEVEGRRQSQEILNQSLVAAKRELLKVMERSGSEFVTEASTAVVMLPNDDMKGRLIGREGRNIRAFEQVTGVDLIIDETPESVVLSCFDPVRRETARLTLMNLMLDGRIHPGRIEELFEASKAEVDRTIRDAGDRAAEQAAVPPLPPKVIETMGRLRFRTSLGQNVLDHSVEVARLSEMLASELGFNALVAKQAGFLHDIGKALPSEWEGPHALIGMEFLRQCGLSESILNAVGAHHREIEPNSPEAEIVIVSDMISASRPGARRENLDHFVKRMAELENLAAGFPGVERAYAVQSGRELRVVVVPESVSDLQAQALSQSIVQKIENELDYPGVIKVTVIRESRYSEVAK